MAAEGGQGDAFAGRQGLVQTPRQILVSSQDEIVGRGHDDNY
jgi:hypothetical protein